MSWVRMAKFVTSEPEPEVVGMATRRLAPLAKKVMALAQSMALPPPRATTISAPKARSRAVPFAASSTVGSGSTPSKISLSPAPDASTTCRAMPFFIK